MRVAVFTEDAMRRIETTMDDVSSFEREGRPRFEASAERRG
jgi:hypothetical protein